MNPLAKHIQRWRDSYNPLRGLSMTRVTALRDAYDRGEMADVQWTFRAVERGDADLFALLERRTAAVLEMDWTVKRVAQDHSGYDEGLACEQHAALRAGYNAIDNLYEAVEHLSLAVFRGFAHVHKQSDTANTRCESTHLEPVDQWHVVRDGTVGDWKYNAEARSCGFGGLADSLRMDPAEFIILEHARPIDHYALAKYARTSLGEKDWTSFIEIYGLPSGVVIMPDNVPPGQELAYAEKAHDMSDGGSGALPHGSEYRPNDAPRGVNPFRGYLDYFTEKLVLVGTGGLLTMLSQSGSGTLAGGAHSDTFKALARGHGRRISEAFQRQFDAPLLQALFPGRPALAYFELDFRSEVNTGEAIDHALKLSQAGYAMTPEDLSEKTGYELQATQV